MNYRTIQLMVAVALLVAVALASPGTAAAIQRLEGNTVTIPSGRTVDDDVYAFGNTINIDGTVDGDVVAFGQVVVVTGEVRGSVLSGAQSVRIDGTVDGSVRAGAAIVEVGGRVGGDVLAGASQVRVTGDVGRDLAAGAQAVTISGDVGRNALIGSDSLTIDGEVGGDVQVQANSVTVTSVGAVGGDLDYWSTAEADVAGNVAGSTTQHEPTADTRDQSAEGGGFLGAVLGAAVVWIQSLMGFLVLGLVMVFGVRQPTAGGSHAMLERFWPSLGAGLLVFFAGPIAAGFVFLFGLFIGAWWLAFVLLMVYWLLLLAGVVIGSLAVGRAILRKAAAAGEPALVWSLVLGLALVWIVGAIPFIGWLAGWAVMVAGAGALVLIMLGKGAKPAAVEAVATPEVAASAAQATEPSVPPPVAPPPVNPPMPPNQVR